jgi:hypothetical protein
VSEFKARQIAQMRFSIMDFRSGGTSLNTLLSKLEAAARAISQDFWEQNIFATAFDLEQINADVVEQRRALTRSEQIQVEALIARLENRLSQVQLDPT